MIRILIVLIVTLLFGGCYSKSVLPQGEYDQEIDKLLKQMTLNEKAGQLTLYTSGWTVTGPQLRDDYLEELKAGRAGNLFNAHTVDYARELQRVAVEETRLGIPLLFGLDVIHGYKTIYPIPLGESSSWNMELIEKTARLSAKEATSAGINWTFNPMVDISRDPRWGRVAEGAGEDTYLAGLIGAAKVRGYQGASLGDVETMMACVKHFAAYGAAQAGRDYHTVDMSDRVLRETYLPPYKAALEAGAATVMTSFNELDGVPASGSQYLMTDILRDEWGFEGFVVTDYTAINEMVPHGVVANEKEAAEKAFKAGVEMDMQGGLYSKYLPELVAEGKIAEKTIDAYVKRVLEMKFKLGLFEDPYRYLNKQREEETLFSDELMNHSLEAARESIVLLKNENNVLPFSKSIKNIALIGPLADNQKDLLGTWHVAGEAEKVITLKQGIEDLLPEVNLKVVKGVGFTGEDKSEFKNAIAAAKASDYVIMAVGEDYTQSGEAASRTNLHLPGVQEQLIEAILALNKPTVIVIMAGRPLTIDKLDKKADAILNTWHLGTMAGKAIAETIFGDNNPNGKLTMTFPASIGQIPVYYNMKNTGRPFDKENKYTSKYLDASNEPLYPFGYGLSYSDFEYSNLKLSADSMTKESKLLASVEVTNKSDEAGKEIVQWYIRDLVASTTRPVKELKYFKKVALAPGETKKIEFEISNKDLIFYTAQKKWESEKGDFKVFVGTNSRDLIDADFVLK